MNGTNMYKFVESLDNNVCMQSTFSDPKAAEFFSFTLYDADGFLMDGNTIINSRDLIAVQSRASEEGIPYQNLVSSIIHKYISGSLRDIAANKKRQSGA